MYQMKDERAQENLEKRHPYENFNKQVVSVDPFGTKSFRVQGNFLFLLIVETNLSKKNICYLSMLMISKCRES